MSKTLLTLDSFDKNPESLFKSIENKYWFGKQKNGTAAICPYFFITDGNDIIVFDNGISKTIGYTMEFNKRPSLLSSRFWNKGPKQFGEMIMSIINDSFKTLVDFTKGNEALEQMQIVETLNALYAIDGKQVFPIYMVRLPHSKPMQMDFLFDGKVRATDIGEFVSEATIGLGGYDTLSAAIAYLIGVGEIIITKEKAQ